MLAYLRRPICVGLLGGLYLASAAGCKDDASSVDTTPCTDCTPTGPMTFALPSPAGAKIWTAPTMDKILREAAPPENPGAAIALYAAKNEYEAFQIAVYADADSTIQLSMSPLSGPGTLNQFEVRRVGYVKIAQPSDASSIKSGYIPDPLVPTAFGTAEPVSRRQNQPFWITVYVPPTATAGDYQGTLTVTLSGSTQAIPVSLHVYNFALPSKIGFDGNWNASMSALGGDTSLQAVEKIKDFFFQHRLVPSSVAWPAGLNYNGGIDYDCATGTFKEVNNAYDFSMLGPKYINGTGWNGTGFPSFQIMQFVDNSTPRPATFCGVSRGPDHYGTAAYNTAWSKLLAAINSYIVAKGYKDKGYYYVQNEPQNQADADLAAYLANLTKTAAPNLRIAVSEEPKPEIAENSRAMGKSYDLWWANLSAYKPDYAKTRMALGETVWWYFLYGDRPPYFNPITIDHPGIESRIPFWGAWSYRIKGFAYYSVTGWGADPYNNPKVAGTEQNGDGFLLYPPVNGQLVSSIRWELMREGVEDYEYFLLASGGTAPKTTDDMSPVDATVRSAVMSPTSFTHDASAFQNLRNQVGLKLEGKVNGWPLLDSRPPGAHPRGAYYINFQDPAGEPVAAPLQVQNHDWQKIGWSAYDPKLGFGWSGPYIGDAMIMKYQYLASGPDVLQRSIIYNDYGRTDTFNYDIENGRYKVTVSIGWQGKAYAKHRVYIEGKPLFDSVATTVAQPYKVASIDVDITDGNITMEAGQFNEYTMLNWMSIEPIQ